MVTIPICLDRFYLPKKSILWSFLYILERVLFHGKIACTKIVGIWCMKINSQKNFSSDLYRILFMHMALLHYIIYLVIAIQPLLCETAQCALFMWLKHNDCGLFFLLFFHVKFMSARLEKFGTVYRLWHSVSSRCIRLLLPRMYIYN